MNETTKIQPRKFKKLLSCALGLMGVVSGGDTKCYDARPDPVDVQTSQAASQNLPNQLGVCSEYRANATHSVAPIIGAKFYINEFKKGPNVLVTENGLINFRMDATIRIVKQPSHGSLVRYKQDAKADDFSKYDYNYLPNKDYVGEDNFQFDISLEGKTLRVYYQVMVFPEDENPNYVGFCNWEKYYHKISATTPALDNASLQALLGAAKKKGSKEKGVTRKRGQVFHYRICILK